MADENGQPQPNVVQPSYVPATVSMAMSESEDGHKWFVLAIADWTGTHYTFFEPDKAEAAARGMLKVLQEARFGRLYVPESAEVVAFETQRKARQRREGKE